MVNLPFQDRTEAGRALAAELAARKLGPKPIVLALPRGGLPLGIEVAARLKAPLDVVVVRKLGVPWQPELAMGAIAGGTRVLEADFIRTFRISKADLDAVVARETAEMERREKLYRGSLPQLELHQRTVVIVDDGLATGSTMTAAARHVRTLLPGKLIVAVPVASSQACRRLKKEADDCICLAEPEPFTAVGEWYINFPQVSDAEVRAILEQSRREAPLVA
jgi:predicted phosphoribosyltransferase